MTIDERTAQLILDAIAWCNNDWIQAEEIDLSNETILALNRKDFSKFCHDRGIEYIEKKVGDE